MGHSRLGDLPKSKKWSAVVSAIASSTGSVGSDTLAADVEAIASQALDAAQGGLTAATTDTGLRYTFYLLTKIVLASREPDCEKHLAQIGITLAEDAGIFDLTIQLQHAIDRHLESRRGRTDISEMAQQAAGEALSTLVGPDVESLFGSGRNELLDALRRLSTKTGFSRLGQYFFAGFMSRFLNFYLCRMTATSVGSDRLKNIGSVSEFDRALDQHCLESAVVVRDFSGGWYSKTEFKEGISLSNTSKFMAVAIKKLQAELDRQGMGA